MTNQEIALLQHRYSQKQLPACRICSATLTPSFAINGSTDYRCEAMHKRGSAFRSAEDDKHYRDSLQSVEGIHDPLVIKLLSEYMQLSDIVEQCTGLQRPSMDECQLLAEAGLEPNEHADCAQLADGRRGART